MTEYTSKPIAELTTAEKLEILAAHVRKLPHTNQPLHPKAGANEFNMAWFATVEESSEGNICGSVCCIGGETVRIFEPETFVECALVEGRFSDNAQRILGITYSEAHSLFSGYFSQDQMEDITPAQAADAILELAGKYKVGVTIEAAQVSEELNK